MFISKRATGRRSNESIEMQPLHLQKGPKGVLRRMPRVRSDEIHETSGEQLSVRPKEKEKTISPIGAGLPLLHRLRLLKEKEVSWITLSVLSSILNKFLSNKFGWCINVQSV